MYWLCRNNGHQNLHLQLSTINAVRGFLTGVGKICNFYRQILGNLQTKYSKNLCKRTINTSMPESM